MSDMTHAIAPKSDQLNADDLIAGPRTVTITQVSILARGADQPISVRYDGDDGKPYKPCKSMARVMVSAWGADASKYAGRSMTLFRDPTVTWGGMAVGGIRISHVSHIDSKLTLALTATRGKKNAYVVQPLAQQPEQTITEDQARADMAAAFTMDELAGVWKRKTMAPHRSALEGYLVECKAALSPGQSEPQNQGNAGDYPGV